MLKLIFTTILLLPSFQTFDTKVVNSMVEKPLVIQEVVLATHYFLPNCRTASGTIYSKDSFECAYNKYKLGTYIHIWYKNTVIRCKITDKTPGKKPFIDLNVKSSKKLGLKYGYVRTSLVP